MIVHTHVHSDHMGCTAEIAREARCPVAYHPGDLPLAGLASNGALKGIGLRGAIMAKVFSDVSFEAVKADLLLDDGQSLSDFGSNVTVLSTPGHTAGSISLLTADGDAIIGDVMMGGYMGGLLRPTKPNFHYFAEDLERARC